MNNKLYKDIAERALWTAAQAFIAIYTVGGVDEVKCAGAAVLAAGISVLKGFIATQVGNPDSASTLKK